MTFNKYIYSFILVIFFNTSYSQTMDELIDFNAPKEYVIEDITITGVKYLDSSVLILLSGLHLGQKIRLPGDEVRKAIESLWKQNLFDDVNIYATKFENNKVWIEIRLLEKPKFYLIKIKGLRKGQAKSLREDELGFLKPNNIINDNLILKVKNTTLAYFRKKGFYSTKVDVTTQKLDSTKNLAILNVEVQKGPKVRVQEIVFYGNQNITEKKLRKTMHETHQISWNIFKSSKFIESDYEADKPSIESKYLSEGYRDAKLVKDTIYLIAPNRLKIEITVDEGHRYYFRNIKWVGNTKYRDSYLDSILAIKKGDIYNQQLLESKLNMNQTGVDVSSLYMDDGYLFFNIQPVEVSVLNDSIDIEIRMNEGPQAIVNRVTVKGNTKTSDKVILRELRVRPGDKFSRSDITRSIRELSQLGYFDPEQIGVNPQPNPVNGTVDIEFKVVEKPSDQIELSGGYGGFGGIIGVLGLTLNNFSAQKMLKKREWTPLPGGDGQRLSIRAQSNGQTWQSYNFSFTEPWLGGKKPKSLTFSMYHSIQGNILSTSSGKLKTSGIVLGLGKRLKKPDDYFVVNKQISYQRFNNDNYSFGGSLPNGVFNDLSFKFIISRNSISDPIYPRSGANISLSAQFTLPYSYTLYRNTSLPTSLMEYYKIKFDAQWFNTIVGKLVLATRFNFGFISNYNHNLNVPAFNRFVVGGSGLVGFSLDGREIVSQRAMPDGYSTVINNSSLATIYNRYTLELRHPVTLNPTATIFGLVYIEAGNASSSFSNYNPFKVYRSAGIGVRVFMPMFGMLGFDIGYRFDHIYRTDGTLYESPKWGNNFFLGQQF
jgi:outer membrane protein insertion porin family